MLTIFDAIDYGMSFHGKLEESTKITIENTEKFLDDFKILLNKAKRLFHQMRFYERNGIVYIPDGGIHDRKRVVPLKIPFELSPFDEEYTGVMFFNLKRISFWDYATHCTSIFLGQLYNVVTFGSVSDFPSDRSKHRGNQGKMYGVEN